MAKFRWKLYPEPSSIVRVTAAAGRHLTGLGAAHTSAGAAGAQAAEVTSGSTIVHFLLTQLCAYYHQEAENPLRVRHSGVRHHRHLASVPDLLGIR